MPPTPRERATVLPDPSPFVSWNSFLFQRKVCRRTRRSVFHTARVNCELSTVNPFQKTAHDSGASLNPIVVHKKSRRQFSNRFNIVTSRGSRGLWLRFFPENITDCKEVQSGWNFGNDRINKCNGDVTLTEQREAEQETFFERERDVDPDIFLWDSCVFACESVW
jgi:hypothetical protein